MQNFYFAQLESAVEDALSPLTDAQLCEINTNHYYLVARGYDGQGLRVPTDLDEMICRYENLDPVRRAQFDRAAYWLDVEARQWHFSMSASFAFHVVAIESLIAHEDRALRGSAQTFRDFLEARAPGRTLEQRRRQMYRLRSGILHGSELMAIDQDREFGWDPSGNEDRQLHDELVMVTRIAVRDWLRNPPAV